VTAQRARVRAYQRDHLARGLCRFCASRVDHPGSDRCTYHLELLRQYANARYRRRKGSGAVMPKCGVCDGPGHNRRSCMERQ